MPSYPKYADLERPDETGLPLAWGVWGPEDQLGNLNHITEQTVRAAAAEIRRGTRFNLDLPLHIPLEAIKHGAHRLRGAPVQKLYEIEGLPFIVRDDSVDGLFLQGSSQWDGLTHIGDPRHGYYNGVQHAQITQQEGTRNGIEHLAEFGVAGRGVVVDLKGHFARTGRSWELMNQDTVSVAELEACLEAQGVTLAPGDILLVRMGWVEAFLAEGDLTLRDALFRDRTYSGLSGGEDMWAFLWDHRVAALACDTVTVEVWPPQKDRASLHLAIPRLGLTLGEMFQLGPLAEDCARDGRYTVFFTSSPLNLRGGVGSPPNAMAIK